MDLREQHEQTQTKVFTRWSNMHLAKKGLKINNVIEDFHDGLMLLQLLGVLTEQTIKPPNKKPKIRVHRVENCSKALQVLTEQEYVDHKKKTVKIKLTNISGRDIVDGKANLILGLVFTMISRIQLTDDGEAATKEGLLIWCQKNTEGYEGVKVKDFHKSWTSGGAFAALVNKFRPDLLSFDAGLDQKSQIEGAFEAASKCGIAQLLDVDDLLVVRPDEKSVFTQVLQYFLVFSSGAATEKAGELISRLCNVLETEENLIQEYETSANAFRTWIDTNKEYIGNLEAEDDSLSSAEALYSELGKWRKNEKLPQYKVWSKVEDSFAELAAHQATNKRPPYTAGEGLAASDLQAEWNQLNEVESKKFADARAALLTAKNSLRKAFANASDNYNTWATSQKATLATITGTKASGTTEELLSAAKSLNEKVQAEGPTLFEEAETTASALEEANIIENEFTTADIGSITVQWQQLQSQCNKSVSRLSARKAEQDRMGSLIAEKKADVQSVFDKFDKDNSGALELHEFSAALKALGENMDDDAVGKTFKSLDTSGDNQIDFDEFLMFYLRRADESLTASTTVKSFQAIAGEGADRCPPSKLEGFITPEASAYLASNCPVNDDDSYDFKAFATQVFG